MDHNIFAIKNGKLELKTHKLRVRFYDSIEKVTYNEKDLYVDDIEYAEWTTQIIPKHQLYELLIDEEISDEYSWMNGIEITDKNRIKEITSIASYGSLDIYKTSLLEYRDEYLLDIDCRISMIELGVN